MQDIESIEKLQSDVWVQRGYWTGRTHQIFIREHLRLKRERYETEWSYSSTSIVFLQLSVQPFLIVHSNTKTTSDRLYV